MFYYILLYIFYSLFLYAKNKNKNKKDYYLQFYIVIVVYCCCVSCTCFSLLNVCGVLSIPGPNYVCTVLHMYVPSCPNACAFLWIWLFVPFIGSDLSLTDYAFVWNFHFLTFCLFWFLSFSLQRFLLSFRLSMWLKSLVESFWIFT